MCSLRGTRSLIDNNNRWNKNVDVKRCLLMQSGNAHIKMCGEVDREKTLNSSNIEYFKLTVHYFYAKVMNKNES
jgi:hypothetical protein